jgi:hypothetical protein
MRYYFIIFFISSIIISDNSIAQRNVVSINTTLYLKMDKPKPREHTSEWVVFKTKQRKSYWYHNSSYLGTMLAFLCEDKSKVQQIPISTLGNYPLKTLEDLEAYFATLTSTQIESYIQGLKTIYIIEVFPNSSTAELAPVVLNVVIR